MRTNKYYEKTNTTTQTIGATWIGGKQTYWHTTTTTHASRTRTGNTNNGGGSKYMEIEIPELELHKLLGVAIIALSLYAAGLANIGGITEDNKAIIEGYTGEAINPEIPALMIEVQKSLGH